MDEYIGYHYPFTAPYPYTSQNIVWHPYSYPYVYQAPYVHDRSSNHPLYQVQQQDPPALNVAGVWTTSFGNRPCDQPQEQAELLLRLRQNGTDVSGWYSYRTNPDKPLGDLEGKLCGNILAGTWGPTIVPPPPPSADNGTFHFTFTPDGKSFTGGWGHGGGAPTNPWNGKKR